jgi:beta-lactamase regulating signal transducer with metallopeptidase domain
MNPLAVSLYMENAARVFAARVLNSLPEGILITAFVWLMLRLLPRQNSRTRFAVWFLALIAVAAVPFTGNFAITQLPHVVTEADRPFFTISTNWAFVILLTWAVVAFTAVLRLIIGIVRVHRLLRACIAINPSDLTPATAKVIAEFSDSHPAVLATSDRINVPAAIGFIKPRIVIPRWTLRDMAPHELNSILLHEYAHLVRHDSWTNLLQKFTRALFCFHPAMWWIDRELSLEREMACDDYVLAETQSPRAYAKCLLALLERNFARRGWSLAQAAVHRAREATLRMSQILDVNRPQGRRVWKPAVALVGAFSFLCLTVLPQTRQFVEFAPEPDEVSNIAARAVPVSPIPMAAAIPAALHVSSPSASPDVTTFAHQRARAHQNVTQHNHDLTTAAQLLAATQNSSATAMHEPTAPRSIPVADTPTIVPVTETVFVVRETRQVGQDSLQWTVCVWRVIVVSGQMANVPVVSPKT